MSKRKASQPERISTTTGGAARGPAFASIPRPLATQIVSLADEHRPTAILLEALHVEVLADDSDRFRTHEGVEVAHYGFTLQGLTVWLERIERYMVLANAEAARRPFDLLGSALLQREIVVSQRLEVLEIHGLVVQLASVYYLTRAGFQWLVDHGVYAP